MLAIQNIKTGTFVYGTDYRYSPCRQRTSKKEMRTYSCLNQAISDYHSRRCGKDYRIVVLKTVEVKRVIQPDNKGKYSLQKGGWEEHSETQDNSSDLTTLQELLCDINSAEIESHLTDGTTMEWLKSWREQANKLVSHLLAKEKVNSSETDKK